MHRRLLILGFSLAALVTTAAPASAASVNPASKTFSATVTDPTCTHHGGKHGAGKLTANAHFEEFGGTTTNYFTIIALVQKQNGSSWQAWTPKSSSTSNAFAATTNGHFWNSGWKYSPLASESGFTFRMKFVYQFWHKQAGPDHLLKSISRFSPAC